MKNLILVLAAIAITAGAYAQTDTTSKKKTPSDIDKTEEGLNLNRDMSNIQSETVLINPVDNPHPDGVMVQNGKVMMVKNGKMTILDKDMSMTNGIKVRSDGSYTKKDGTKVTLKEGQHLDMSGNLVTLKTNKDKNLDHGSDSTTKKDK